jgi:hypothetical protein
MYRWLWSLLPADEAVRDELEQIWMRSFRDHKVSFFPLKP